MLKFEYEEKTPEGHHKIGTVDYAVNKDGIKIVFHSTFLLTEDTDPERLPDLLNSLLEHHTSFMASGQ